MFYCGCTGHTVKNPAVGHSKACAAITADRRWICTGTPLSNDITDLLGQFSVLHMEPFSSKSWFDARVKTAFLGELSAGLTAEGIRVTHTSCCHPIELESVSDDCLT